jgi:uncharacterized protein
MHKSLSWRSPKTEVKSSPIHGLGLFARESIGAGEVVAVKGGYIYDAEQWHNADESLESSEIQIGESLFIAPAEVSEREGAMLYTNHSCDPNIAIDGQIVFVAMRDIAAGEELTHDWATTDDLDFELKCRCASPRCRGVISGRDWQRPELQARYKGWFCWHLQRRIDAESQND